MKFDELSAFMRFLIMLGVAAILGAGVFYIPGSLSTRIEENKSLAAKIAAKKSENDQLRTYIPKLTEMDNQIAHLQEQIELEKKIVPEEKDADRFIKMLHDTASGSGIEIRRYTALPGANHEFYGEVPFAIDIDGPYYSVLNFFGRVNHLERIVNITNMQMANPKNTGAAKIKSTYNFAPQETVVASCTATTFFSHDQQAPAAPPAPGPKK
ncbi:MAG TPA: type 4a pilus biogenesis protein PilO [Candidatus Angelobacter sp.]|nr:type 4a pilus biogenesis protein PilO [Candidatus Angelobacter sp.]